MTTSAIPSESTPDLAFMTQHLFTAILWVDEALQVRWLNTQAEQLLTVSRGRLLNHSILTLFAPEELNGKKSNNVSDSSKNEVDPNTHKTCTLTERFAHAQQYQQPFIDHDHTINPQLSSGLPVLVDYSVTPVIYQQHAYFIIEMWGKDRLSQISEEQHQQQQYNVARHMLRSVAHEVKNPLAGIRGAAQLLERQFNKFNNTQNLPTDSWPADKKITHDLPAATAFGSNSTDASTRTVSQKLRNYTDIIISETDRLTQLVSQLLGSTQLPQWQTLNIHEPLEHVLTLVLSQYLQQQGSLITVQRDYDLSLPELQADKDQLIQVFLNLINNACEAMTEYQQQRQQENKQQAQPSKLSALQTISAQSDSNYQPKLEIQTRVAFQHTIGSQQHKQVLKITITDNGGGIDPALIGQIFFPMVTSRATGTGLGLAIVQDIISRHHGMIEVSSHQSQNCNQNYSQTRFTLYLPFSQPTPASTTHFSSKIF